MKYNSFKVYHSREKKNNEFPMKQDVWFSRISVCRELNFRYRGPSNARHLIGKTCVGQSCDVKFYLML